MVGDDSRCLIALLATLRDACFPQRFCFWKLVLCWYALPVDWFGLRVSYACVSGDADSVAGSEKGETGGGGGDGGMHNRMGGGARDDTVRSAGHTTYFVRARVGALN